MSRSIDRLFFSGAALAGALAIGMLAGCAAGTPSAISNIRYDLGPAAPPATSGPMPAVKVLDVSSSHTLDSDSLLYRLSYADAQRTASYANSHWTTTPAQLLTQRGRVLPGGDGGRAPVLKIDLDEFEQVFDGTAESHGALTARATLIQGDKVLGQRTFVARAPASTPDAAGGAGALAAASDDFVAQVVAWLGVQALVAGQ
jgi:cholesterol transport system auxiliary component